jgi:hypothetical protein
MQKKQFNVAKLCLIAQKQAMTLREINKKGQQ